MKSPRKNFSTYALVGHLLLAMAAGVVIMMYVPVVSGGVSGEGAGMGVFLMLYFLGIPLGLVAVATAILSIHSPEPGLLVPTVLLVIGVPVGIALENDLAFVVALGLYVVGVIRALILQLRQ